MTKVRLKRLRALIKEAEHLQEELKAAPYITGDIVTDSVKDYRTGYPRRLSITGYERHPNYSLKTKIERRLLLIKKEVSQMDEWLKTIEDPQIRDILIMQYRNGRTQEQIADELGYTRGGLAAKLKRFWDSQSETQKTK